MNETSQVLSARDRVDLLFFARQLIMIFTNIKVVRSIMLCCEIVK
jgi:hypothetical protein